MVLLCAFILSGASLREATLREREEAAMAGMV
jgi:hypothetical protein